MGLNRLKMGLKKHSNTMPKNLTAKNPAKIFYDFLNKKPAKNP